MNYIRRRAQKGFTLLELVFVLAIAGLMMVLEIEKKMSDFEQLQARQLGLEIFQYSKGVQDFITKNAGNMKGAYALPYTPTPGAAWLRFKTCGGTDHEQASDPAGSGKDVIRNSHYIDCLFLAGTNELTNLGKLTFKTTITKEEIVVDPGNPSATPPRPEVKEYGLVATTVVETPSGDPLIMKLGGTAEHSLQGLAAAVAAGSSSINAGTASLLTSSGQVFYCISETSRDGCAGNKERIVIRNTTFSSNDTWLRVDHGNKMQSGIEFDASKNDTFTDPSVQDEAWGLGFSVRQIRNVARIYNVGNATQGSSLFLGMDKADLSKRASAIRTDLLASGVVVDSDLSVLKEIKAFSDITTYSGNIEAIESEDENGVITGGNVLASQNVIAGNAETLDLSKGGYVHAVRSGSNHVDKTKASTEEGSGFFDSELWAKDQIGAPKFVDYNNSGYYLDPDNLSNLNRINTTGTLNVNGITTLRNKLDVTGTSLFRNHVKLNRNLEVDGNTQLDGNFYASKNNGATFKINGKNVNIRALMPTMPMQSMHYVSDGTVINKPTCSQYGLNRNYARILVTPGAMDIRSRQIGTEAGGNAKSAGSYLAYARHRNGSQWTVYIRSAYANNGSGRGIATTYCVVQ